MEGANYLYRQVDWYYINRISLEYSFGFLYLFYVKSLLHIHFKITWKHFLFMLPFVLAFTYNIMRALYVASYIPAEEKHNYLYIQDEFLIMEGPAILFSLFCYTLGFMEISKYQKAIKGNFSFIEKRNLTWLKNLTFAAYISGITWLGYYFFEVINYPQPVYISDYYPLWIYSTGVVVITGYKNLMQPELLTTLKKLENSSREKYKTSKLDETDIQKICRALESFLRQEKIYRKSDLTMADLSQKMQIPAHHISQSINQGLNMSFYDLINAYRVEEVKKNLADERYQKLTLLAVAFEAGFNSKNSFNKAFKKFTGHAPSYYKNTVNNKPED